MSMTGLVIFDNDGTLVDSEPIANEALAESFREFGIVMTGQDAQAKFVGQHMSKIVCWIEAQTGLEVPVSWVSQYNERLMDKLSTDLHPTPHIESTINQLLETGFAICVASQSSPERIKLSLQKVGLFTYFKNAIFSASYVKRPKPNPDLFEFAAAKMNFKPEDCLVVEDSAAGLSAGRAAKMQTILFDGLHSRHQNFEPSDFVHRISDIRELLNLVVPSVTH